ncbi:MAG: alpha/beta fold hydrolase [Acidobacteriota bacterium]
MTARQGTVLTVICFLLMSTPGLWAEEAGNPTRDLVISVPGAELAATVSLPAAAEESSGPVPGVVLLHGSGPSTRAFQAPLTAWFLARGFAVLAFDKRGCGASTGSWIRSSLDDLAGDAAAALDALRSQPEVAGGRVGFFGHSQAGWVVPRAVAGGAEADFAIVVAGGGARPTTVESWGYQQAFERAGLEDAERRRGFEWIERYFAYLESCRGREALARGLEGERGRPWSAIASLDKILPSESNCPNWRWVATYDPLPDIAGLGDLPMLVLFGGRDSQAPSEVSIARWRLGLTLAGNDHQRLVLLPQATHSLGLGMHPGGHGAASASRPEPDGDYMKEIASWLRDQGLGGLPRLAPTAAEP